MEDLPYRSPVQSALKNPTPEAVDERDLSTLVQVRDLLKVHVESMPKNFNAFDPKLTPEELFLEVRSKQLAHAILEPVYLAVKEVVDKIHKQKR